MSMDIVSCNGYNIYMTQTNKINNYLIFTDLDGTLLDHESYSFNAANEMLTFIKTNNIPLIIVTSKTKEEVLEIQKKLGINYPFIIENGAGVFIPKDDSFELIALGKLYEETVSFFQKYLLCNEIKGFHQMDEKEVSQLTGLSLEKATLAKKRTFSEPFICNDTQKLQTIQEDLKKNSFDIVKGGRFYHLISLGQDKANAMDVVKSYYEKLNDKTYQTIALGDGENDLTMLSAADQAVLIKKFDNSYVTCNINDVIKTKFIGPKGWNESLKRYFDVK